MYAYIGRALNYFADCGLHLRIQNPDHSYEHHQEDLNLGSYVMMIKRKTSQV